MTEHVCTCTCACSHVHVHVAMYMYMYMYIIDGLYTMINSIHDCRITAAVVQPLSERYGVQQWWLATSALDISKASFTFVTNIVQNTKTHVSVITKTLFVVFIFAVTTGGCCAPIIVLRKYVYKHTYTRILPCMMCCYININILAHFMCILTRLASMSLRCSSSQVS